jgi:subfamily B ATP-binding cassette protein MsbA
VSTSAPDESGWPTYRRLLGYSARYWPLAIIATVGMVFDAACGSAFTLIIKPMLDELFVHKDPATIFWMPLIIVGLFFVRGVATFTADFSMARIATRCSANTSHCLRHISRASHRARRYRA